MSTDSKKEQKRYTLGEEIFNSVSHGVGGGLSIAGTVILIVFAVIYSDAWGVVSSAIYGASLIILYTMSTLYHAITNDRAKGFFRIMDHNTIFFLIAGTYTPITLVPLRGAFGWTLFGVIWAAAVVGIVLNSIDLEKFRKPSVVCYILMGWAVVFAINPMLRTINKISLLFLLIGGLFYTIGVIFYVMKKKRYFHSIWHLFTIGGSVFHWFLILLIMIHNGR
ncbi:PAQR family membrane homeostasis protein TrhA [Ruminococcus albus]|uniref:Hemolysin III n=1 Tax=Ruminococcus albus TaxID=1264 RepID=A0A1H7MAZ5_RUMAL|nr:hemolysin III family protein [Ruminococcus albus]SEL07777.1 hemolysin III [Ruminococcus albus]